jgi:uncharacterized protein
MYKCSTALSKPALEFAIEHSFFLIQYFPVDKSNECKLPAPDMANSLQSATLSPAKRWFSLAELIIGSTIVIGHNVYRVIPNEVPILVALALISFRLRDGGWGIMGLRRPASWVRTVLFALMAAAARILLGGVVDQVTSHFWPAAVAPGGSEQITGNFAVALRWLALVWTFAAFGEEIAYRSYLLTRAADVGCRLQASWWIGVLAVSILFGYGHFYKGPAGMVDSGMAGLILGSAFVLSGRNLWIPILAHGFIDTFGIVAMFLGWAS